ncbi:MAG: presqualene diphosphate synthase HpnD [Chromatiales bacterium]|nr:presqualene diphosphate synthase HpnD [Chromatiales bacterium]
MTPEEYCAAQVNKSRSSFRLSFLLLNRERQQAIHALYAFCREVDDIVDDVDENDDPAATKQLLDDWRSEINSLYQGSPTHPIGHALLPAIQAYNLSKNHLMAIIDGMEMDLEKSRYANFDELYLYCYRAAGVVGLLVAKIFGYQDPHTEEYAEALGIALQLTNILRDVGEDLERDRIYIPQDELARFGLSDATLLYPENIERLIPLFESMKTRAESYYQKALTSLPTVDRKAQLSGLVMGAIYHALLKQITAENYPVLSKRVRLSTPGKLVTTLKYLLTRRYG